MPDTSIDTVTSRLHAYLASQGVQLTPEQQAEVTARLNGHADVHAQRTYERRAATFLVLELHFDDITNDGYVLSRTLEFMPHLETSDRTEALAFAQQCATERNRPFVVVNGAYEHQALKEEPRSNGEGFSVYQTLGQVFDRKPMKHSSAVAEDFTLLDAAYMQKMPAISFAKKMSARLMTELDGTPLLYVCDQDTGEITWLFES